MAVILRVVLVLGLLHVALGQWKYMGDNSIESYLFDGVNNRERYILVPEDRKTVGADGIMKNLYLSTTTSLMAATVEEATADGPGDPTGPKRVWQPLTGTCEEGKGVRYIVKDDPYFPWHTFYDTCGNLMGAQAIIRSPTTDDGEDIGHGSALSGGYQHYDPDGTWAQAFQEIGVGGMWYETMYQFTSDPEVAFPGWNATRHVTYYWWLRNHTTACNCFVDEGFYTDRLAIGFRLQAGSTYHKDTIAKYIVDGSYHMQVKFYEELDPENPAGNSNPDKPLVTPGYLDYIRCIPFMGVHAQYLHPPPWMGYMTMLPMYSPFTNEYMGFEMDVHIMQEFGNRALEKELYGVGGPAMDPSHNDFHPWNITFNSVEYCTPGKWNPVTGFPFAGVPGLSPPDASWEDAFSFYAWENWCRNPNVGYPHASFHMFFGVSFLDVVTMCPQPLSQATTQPGDGKTDYTYRPIDAYREPFAPGAKPFVWGGVTFGAYYDHYERVTEWNTLNQANFEPRQYWYYWLDAYPDHMQACRTVNNALGSVDFTGGGMRNPNVFNAFSFNAEPCEYCIMLQNKVRESPSLNAKYGSIFDDYNMEDLPCLPRPRRVSNSIFRRPQNISQKFVNMLQTYFGMFLTFDTVSFERDFHDHTHLYIEKCDSVKDPLCECCSYEETLHLSNINKCFWDNLRCVQVGYRSAIFSGTVPLIEWYEFTPISETFGRTSNVLLTHSLDLSGIYETTEFETHRAIIVPGQAYIHDHSSFLPNLYFLMGNFFMSYKTRGLTPYEYTWTLRGDVRNNKNVGARAIVDIFVRNHNRLVDECYKGLIGCDQIDTTDPYIVFHMARRWNIANYQRIIFREYVPSLLGIPLKEYDRNADGLAFTRPLPNAYNKTNIPRTTLEFSLGYRGHNKIKDKIVLKNNFLDDLFDWDVGRGHWNISALYEQKTGLPIEGRIEQILYGLVSDLAPEHNAGFSEANRNQMQYDQGTGDDLAAWNLLRCREYGAPPINAVRAAYGVGAPYADCYELTGETDVAGRLTDLYGPDCINRIELYPALIFEKITQEQSTVGPTNFAIWFHQFNKWRNSDRYYYENQLSAEVATSLGFEQGELSSDSFNPIPFSDSDLDEIFRTNFEALIALNTNIKVGELGNNLFFVRNRQLQTLTIDGNLVSGEFDDPEGFELSQQLSSTVKLWWRIDKDEITIRYQSLTPGWLGFGIDPDAGTMRNGDIYFCRVYDDTLIGEITDRFALDVGPPRNDTDIGGQNNIHSVETSQVDGSTSCQFTRKLDTGDFFDKPIEPGFTKIMFAFNPYTDQEVYHGPTRQSDIEVDFYYQYPVVEVSDAILIIIGIFSGLGILYCLFTLIIIAIKGEYFRFMSPLFCQLICVGAAIAFGAPLTILKQPPTEASCEVYPWLLGFGFTLAFSCLFAKTWRLWRLFSRKSLKAKVIDNAFLLKIVAVFMIIMVVYLIIWISVDGSEVDRGFYDEQEDSIVYLCDTPTVWWGIFVGLVGFALVLGCILTFLIRNLPQEYNDAEAIGMSIYNSTLMLAIGAAIGWGLDYEPSAVAAAKGFAPIIAFWFMVLVLFGPTHFRIFISKKEPQTYKSTMAMGSGGSGVSGLTSGSTNA